MSKKKISLTKLKTVAEKSVAKKQITISKFFSAPQQHSADIKKVEQEQEDDRDFPLVVVDDDSPKKTDTQVILYLHVVALETGHFTSFGNRVNPLARSVDH
jgi:hypothetical protein